MLGTLWHSAPLTRACLVSPAASPSSETQCLGPPCASWSGDSSMRGRTSPGYSVSTNDHINISVISFIQIWLPPLSTGTTPSTTLTSSTAAFTWQTSTMRGRRRGRNTGRICSCWRTSWWWGGGTRRPSYLQPPPSLASISRDRWRHLA